MSHDLYGSPVTVLKPSTGLSIGLVGLLASVALGSYGAIKGVEDEIREALEEKYLPREVFEIRMSGVEATLGRIEAKLDEGNR